LSLCGFLLFAEGVKVRYFLLSSKHFSNYFGIYAAKHIFGGRLAASYIFWGGPPAAGNLSKSISKSKPQAAKSFKYFRP